MKTIDRWTNAELDAYIWEDKEPEESCIEQHYQQVLMQRRKYLLAFRIIGCICSIIICGIVGAAIMRVRQPTSTLTPYMNHLYDDQDGAIHINLDTAEIIDNQTISTNIPIWTYDTSHDYIRTGPAPKYKICWFLHEDAYGCGNPIFATRAQAENMITTSWDILSEDGTVFYDKQGFTYWVEEDTR